MTKIYKHPFIGNCIVLGVVGETAWVKKARLGDTNVVWLSDLVEIPEDEFWDIKELDDYHSKFTQEEREVIETCLYECSDYESKFARNVLNQGWISKRQFEVMSSMAEYNRTNIIHKRRGAWVAGDMGSYDCDQLITPSEVLR